MRKTLVLLALGVMLLAGCTTKLEADFFKLTLPGQFSRNEIGTAIPAKILFSTKSGKVELINELTSDTGYITINWNKRDIKEGDASSKLGIGTLPTGSVKTLEATKKFSDVMSWEETVVVMDEKQTAELRWLYHVVVPLDGGVLDILCSLTPNKAMLKDVQGALGAIEITDKGFFKK